jgi:hypothetical protein
MSTFVRKGFVSVAYKFRFGVGGGLSFFGLILELFGGGFVG